MGIRAIRFAVCILTAIAVLPVLFVPSAAAAQNGREIVVQFNAFGTKSNTAYNHDVAPAVVVSLIARNPKPAVISFNEICWYQWDFIWDYLRASRDYYVAYAHWATGPLDNCNGSIFGNVIVSLHGATPAVPHGPIVYSDQAAETEKRGAACLHALVINATACSTHLINDEAEAYDQQIELAIAISQWVIEGVPMFVLGDFNLETGGPPLNAHIWFRDWWYVLFAEGDRPNATLSDRRDTLRDYVTHIPSKSIDYSFRRVPNLFTDVACICWSPYSDHAWYETYAN